MFSGKMYVNMRAVMTPGSEHVSNPFLIFRTRPAIPPEASNIKLWQPVDSHIPVRYRLSTGFTLSLLVATLLVLIWFRTANKTGQTNSRLESTLNPIGRLRFIYCSYDDEHEGFAFNLFANSSQSASLPVVCFLLRTNNLI